jgi:hypothetical protein
MASTANPRDPMPCALASVLLPESLAHGCHMQNALFLGPACQRGRVVVCARPVSACGVRSCSVGGRAAGVGSVPGCLEAVPGTAGGRRQLVVVLGTGRSWGVCSRVGVWQSER